MAKAYRASSFAVRASNALVTTLLRLGVPMSGNVLLTVRGRTSGVPRTTPVTILEERGGERWLIAPFGAVNWVRNLRAAGTATITRGRATEAITVTELPPEQAGSVLKRVLPRVPAIIRASFDVTPAAPVADFVREAPRHPVFRVQTAGKAVGGDGARNRLPVRYVSD